MNRLKGIVSAVVVWLTLLVPASASATVLTDGSGIQLKAGTSITAENEGATAMHFVPLSGEIKCEKSHFGGKTTNDGGAGTDVTVNVEALGFLNCASTMAVLAKGTLSIKATGGGDAELYSTGTELTFKLGIFHCTYKTNNTKLGTITGSTTTKGAATLDLEATIPSTSPICGSTAQWTGSYKFTTPNVLNID